MLPQFRKFGSTKEHLHEDDDEKPKENLLMRFAVKRKKHQQQLDEQDDNNDAEEKSLVEQKDGEQKRDEKESSLAEKTKASSSRKEEQENLVLRREASLTHSHQQQAVLERRICPHHFSAAGCALGEYCQFLHHQPLKLSAHPPPPSAGERIARHGSTLAAISSFSALAPSAVAAAASSSSSGGGSDVVSLGRGSVRSVSASGGASGSAPSSSSSSSAALQRPQSMYHQTKLQAIAAKEEHDRSLYHQASFAASAASASASSFSGAGGSKSQQQEQEAAAAANVTFQRNRISSFRWFWRELAKDFCSADRGLAWRSFEAKLESEIEAAFTRWREEDGSATTNVCMNKYTIDFDKMMVCSALDGGSRRAIQRIRIDAGYFWFACEYQGRAAWKFPQDVSAVLEREYLSGNTTTFGLRIGPRCAGLIDFGSMQWQVLPEMADLLSNVLDKDRRPGDTTVADLQRKNKLAEKKKKKQQEQEEKRAKRKEKQKFGGKSSSASDSLASDSDGDDGDDENDSQQKGKLGKKKQKNSNKKNKSGSGSSSSQQEDDSDSDDSDIDEDEVVEVIEEAVDEKNELTKHHLAAEEASRRNNSNEEESSSEEEYEDEDEEDQEGEDQQQEEQGEEGEIKIKVKKKKKKKKNAEKLTPEILMARKVSLVQQQNIRNLIAAENENSSSSFTSSNTGVKVLTMRLHRQPLQVTAACGPTNFFDEPKLRERAVFVADSGAVLFTNPELGPDVFSRDEMQSTVLPCIRAAVIGATPNSSSSSSSPSAASSHSFASANAGGGSNNNNNNNNASSSSLPQCGDRCLNPDAPIRNALVLASVTQHMHNCVHRCAAGKGTGADCYLKDVLSAHNRLQTSPSSTSSPSLSNSPFGNKKFQSVSAILRARLHDQFFLHGSHSSNSTSLSSSANPTAASASGGNNKKYQHHQRHVSSGIENSDAGQIKWHNQQIFLRQFRHFADFDDGENPSSSGALFSSRTTATSSSSSSQQQQQQQKQLDKQQRLNAYNSANEDSLLPIQLLSEGTPEWNKVVQWLSGNFSQNTFDHGANEETSAILQLRPRIRRVQRFDLCARYRRTRNEVQSAWLRVDRSLALESREQLCYIPATHDVLTSLMAASDAPQLSKQIVFLNFLAAVFAAKGAMRTATTSGSSTAVGILVVLAFLGPTAIAESPIDRNFIYPSVHPNGDNDPLSPNFRCVLNTSAMIKDEESFAALFSNGLYAPLYFISLTSP